MTNLREPLPPAPASSPRPVWLAAGALLTAIGAVWHATLSYPFIFDDLDAIVGNPSIRHLWPLTEVLWPPADGSGAAGRPLINLSFALNYAVSGYDVWSYHALNLLIHAVASLALFGLARRTLLTPAWRDRFGHAATRLALVVAALWALHPLQTESVTCVVQRTESLMGCLFLLAFYTFARGTEDGASRGRWLAGSVLACLLGMATKEVMVTAPPLLLLYDRTFVAGSFREAWRRRRGYYLALSGTILFLGVLVAAHGAARGEAAGFGLGVSAWEYLLTQSRAIVLYLRLTFWPHPLNFDHGTAVVRSLGEVWVHALVILGLLAGTVVALWRRPVLGFLGAWFFVILAPSSSFVPLVAQTVAEHRMYLPLAALAALATIGLFLRLSGAGLWLGLGAAGVLGVVAVVRNADYRDPIVLWSDSVAKAPENPRAHYNLALLLASRPDRTKDALAHYETAVRLKPDYVDARINLAVLLAKTPDRQPEALVHYEAALRLKPDLAETHNNLAALLAVMPGRQPDAIAHYESALRLKPDLVPAHFNLANLLTGIPDRRKQALAHYESALRLQPDFAEAHHNLAMLQAAMPGRQQDALVHYEAAVRLRPDYAEAHNNFATLLATMPERRREAVVHYESALRLKPDSAAAHYNLAALLATMAGGQGQALAHYEAALRLRPDYAEAHFNLASLLASMPDRQREALGHYEAAARLLPNHAIVQFNFARQLEKFDGRQAEARRHYETALRLEPNFTAAKAALERLQQAEP